MKELVMTMKRMEILLFAGFCLMVLADGAWAARERPFIDQMPTQGSIDPNDIEEYEWQEEKEIKIPPYPDDDDLLQFEVDGDSSNFEYYIDTKSLSVGKDDNVARYTLVVESQMGTRNVFYEGIRCNTEEYKLYAFGASKGGMKRVREPHWQPILNDMRMQYRVDLLNYYVCRSSFPRPPEDVVNAIKYPDHGDQRTGHKLF